MHKEMDIIDDYEGGEYQVVAVMNVTQPGSVGELEINYRLMNRHGQVIDVMDWQLADYNNKQKSQ